MTALSVIVCTHNPHATRWERTLAGLAAQTLPRGQWNLIVIDNASAPEVDAAEVLRRVPNAKVVREPKPGLSHARVAGLGATDAPLLVFADDDNVLAPDYLAACQRRFSDDLRLGLAGGRIAPEFEREPEAWHREFLPLLALRDFGDQDVVARTLRPEGSAHNQYPAFGPAGAGMAARREAMEAWLKTGHPFLTGRQGKKLGSGEDNDIVLCAMKAGWAVGYFPELTLVHLIPAGRLAPDYLARLNYGIQESWLRVLALHDASPWGPLTHRGAALRKARAWIVRKAWQRPVGYIRWRGACGHFDGRVPSAHHS
ncbi:MAG TPA: glycosyltransferase [Opitutaceae bacterium]